MLRFCPVEREHVRTVLDAGRPVIFDILVEDSALSPQPELVKGIIPSPTTAPVDRHCLLAVGYDATQRLFACRDSLGPNRGVNGNINLSFDYLLGEDG